MTDAPKKKQLAVPLPKMEVGEPPESARGKNKSKPDRWTLFARILEGVRALEGRSAKISHHPKARQVAVSLRAKHPDFVFTVRTIKVGEKETQGIWARLNVPVKENPPVDLPSVNAMSEGV